MEDCIYVQIPIGVDPSNYFLHENKKYPFNYNILKLFSRNLETIFSNIQADDCIQILNEKEKRNITLNEESIINFILFCHNKNYEINQRTAIPINYLAKKYNVNELIDKTTNLIKNNHELKVDFLEQDNFYLTNKLNDITEKTQNLLQLVKNQQNQIMQLNNQIKLNKPPINIPYTSSHEGIVSLFKNQIHITNGGACRSDYKIEFITEYNNSHFCNYNDYQANKSDDVCWILFDFLFKKVELQSYLIRSNSYGPDTYFHPKSWKILGSNDKENWTILDSRNNEESLNGPLYQKNFTCQNTNNECQNNRFRYIKYHQNECWSNKSQSYYNLYNIYITYFELFGKIYD